MNFDISRASKASSPLHSPVVKEMMEANSSKLRVVPFIDSQAVVDFVSFPTLGHIPMVYTMTIHSWGPLPQWLEAKDW